MIEGIKQDMEKLMGKTIDSLHSTLSKIRAGRPNPSMLDSIEADYFDAKTPLKQLANISVTDASTLSLNIWDKNAIKPIEKAIIDSSLGLSPVVNGTNILIKIPPLTQERRDELKKLLRKEGENTKISLRNIRRSTNTTITNLEKDKKISKDFERDYMIEIQDITDKYIKKSEEIISDKTREISEV